MNKFGSLCIVPVALLMQQASSFQETQHSLQADTVTVPVTAVPVKLNSTVNLITGPLWTGTPLEPS